ncbi:MAG TPA: ABC transporter substrate-binding protein, partial [Synergistetes bacterium]|nr:ABC transporter substrate-binding protein [Synergistota bacterium]
MKKPKWFVFFLLHLFLVIFLAAAPAYPASEFQGRIVSLAPSVTESLFALGSGD